MVRHASARRDLPPQDRSMGTCAPVVLCGMGMRALVVLCGIGMLGHPQASLEAQAPALVSGSVVDDATGRPIGGATVALLAPGERVVRPVETGDDGAFSVSFRPGGVSYRLRATRIGLQPAISAPLRIQYGDTLQVILRMNIQAVALPALEIVADRRAHPVGRLEGFYRRSLRGFGGFIHREDIERRNPRSLTEMLPEHGIDVEGSRRGLDVGLLSRRFSCAPLVYIDGARVTPMHVDAGHPLAVLEAGRAVDMVHPSDVEGIEVYRGGGSVPGEFGGFQARCGVIVIWTRAGTD